MAAYRKTSLCFTLGKYPKLVLHFALRRNVLFFILETYVPSTLLVVLSWVSFWISQSSVPARTCIGQSPYDDLIASILKLSSFDPGFLLYGCVNSIFSWYQTVVSYDESRNVMPQLGSASSSRKSISVLVSSLKSKVGPWDQDQGPFFSLLFRILDSSLVNSPRTVHA